MQSAGSPFSKKPLRRISICPCGESVLYEVIQTGTVYSLDMSTLRDDFTYRCGKCRSTQNNVRVVKASQQLNPDLPMQWVPYDLFTEETAPAAL